MNPDEYGARQDYFDDLPSETQADIVERDHAEGLTMNGADNLTAVMHECRIRAAQARKRQARMAGGQPVRLAREGDWVTGDDITVTFDPETDRWSIHLSPKDMATVQVSLTQGSTGHTVGRKLTRAILAAEVEVDR